MKFLSVKSDKPVETQIVIGKLYQCPKYYLLVYPSVEKAPTRASHVVVAAQAGKDDPPSAAQASRYWSHQLNCKVQYSNPKDIFMVLEVKEFKGEVEIYLKCLFPEFSGWIVYQDWLKIQETNP